MQQVWLAFLTRARCEKRAEALVRRAGHQCYVPVAPQLRQWHDRKKRVSMPLFPSYVFARTAPPGMSQILSVRNIVDVARFGDRPAVVTPEEIENIARFARALENTAHVPPMVEYEPGDRVRVTTGDFAGVEATVIETRGRSRVLIGISSIRLAFDVDISIRYLQKIR